MKSILLFAIAIACLSFAPRAWADDHGDTLSSATLVTTSDTSGSLDSTTDQDWFKIVIEQGGRHWIYTTGGTDTSGYLFDNAGRFISNTWVQTNSGDRYNFYMEGVLATGTYYLRVKGGSTVLNTGAYQLSVRTFRHATGFDTPNLTESFGVRGEVDLYRITVVEEGFVWIYTTGGTDTAGYLYDDAGAFISNSWVDDNSGVGYNFRCGQKLGPGTYYLRVRAGSNGAAIGDYTLSIRNWDNALRFEGSNRASSLAISGDLDLYRIEVTRTGPVAIYTTGATDADGYLFDESGNFISNSFVDSNSGSNYNFHLGGTLGTGTYYLRVQAGDNGQTTGSYDLHVRQAATATPIHDLEASSHSIGTPGDVDMFVISTSGGTLNFSSSGTTETRASLYRSGGDLVTTDTGGNFSITRTGMAAGIYYLFVNGKSVDLTTGNYQLNASFATGDSVASLSSSSSHVAGSGTAEVSVVSSGAWSVQGLPSWASVSASSGSGNATLSFAFSPNPGGSSRTATVMIGGVAHVITQNPDGSTVGSVAQPSLQIFPAIILAIDTEIGANYRIETSDNLTDWTDTGVSFVGNGSEMSVAIERTQTSAYFRAHVE